MKYLHSSVTYEIIPNTANTQNERVLWSKIVWLKLNEKNYQRLDLGLRQSTLDSMSVQRATP